MPKPSIISFRHIGVLCAVGLLAACGGTENNGVRSGPQAVHPSPSALAQGTSASTAAANTPRAAAKAVFPGVTANADLAGPIRAFASTCLTHSPNIPALAKAASAAGFSDVNREGKSIFSANFGGKTPVSFQVNVASSFAHECAVTVVVDQKNKTNVRETFFNAIGLSHTNGVGQAVVRGQTFSVTHKIIGGGALGVNEHAFLLQK